MSSETDPPRTGKFDRKRLDVLRAAARVFARLGYHRASLQDVGEELGMTSAALYYYFNSKEALLAEIGRLATDRIRADVEAARALEAPGLARVEAFFRAYARHLCDDYGRCFALTRGEDRSPALQAAHQENRRDLDHAVRDLVCGGVEDGSIRACDPRELTALLFGAFNALPRRAAAASPEAVEPIAEGYLEMIRAGVAGPARGA